MKPFVNSIKGQDFFRMQYFAMRDGRLVCPNCGKFHQPKYLDKDISSSVENMLNYMLNEGYRLLFGLCSEQCTKEFLYLENGEE